MDSPVIQIQIAPVAPPEAPKSRDVAPGRKRDDQGETRDGAAATALTVSFAEILQSKRLDLKIGAEEQTKREPAMKTKQTGLRKRSVTLPPVQGQLAAVQQTVKQSVKQPVVEVQAKETLENAKELAGVAMKAAPDKPLIKENKESLQSAAGKQIRESVTGAQVKTVKEDAAVPAESAPKTLQEKPLIKEKKDSVPSAELPRKEALAPAEEALLKEMIQKNGAISDRKNATLQRKGFVEGEPLDRREGIGAVKSMMAKEGEVLKNISGGDDAQSPDKLKTAKPGKARQASTLRDVPEGEGKAFQPIPSADKMKQEFANLMENTQDKLASAGEQKKQSVQKDIGVENHGVFLARGDLAAPVQDKTAGSPTAVRPQAVMSQILDGAVEVLRNGSGRMALTLQPPQLGTLDLDIAVKDNRVTMIMLADNQEVKQMLQSGMDDLRNALQDKGFQIDRMEVLVQNRPDDAGAGFWQEAGFARDDSPGRGQRKREPEAAPAVQGLAERTIRSGQNGISIFA